VPIDSSDPRSAGFVRVTLMTEVRPELPASLADAIIVGTISSVQPYLSQNHTLIYSELSVHVENIIDQIASIPTKTDITIDQIGGSALLPGGRILRTAISGLGSALANGGRYLFFMKYLATTDAYSIVKAWDLTTGKAKAMAADDLGRVGSHVSQYDGMDAQAFLSLASQLKAGNTRP